MGSFSVWHWLVVLAIVLLVFGTKKIGNIGADLGKAIKGFKDGMKGGEAADAAPAKAVEIEGAKATPSTQPAAKADSGKAV